MNFLDTFVLLYTFYACNGIQYVQQIVDHFNLIG